MGHRHDDFDDTRDRLYTPEELNAFALAAEARAASRPSTAFPPPVLPAGVDREAEALTDAMADPLADPYPGPVNGQVQARAQTEPPMPPTPEPSEPPVPPTPPSPEPPTPPVPPTPPSPEPPTPPVPPTPPSPEPTLSVVTGPPVEPTAEETEPTEPRRFMTATDFLDRRAGSGEPGPATWGWRGFVRKASGGLIAPKMGREELVHERKRAAIQRDFDGPRTIAFINPKGGAAKTTSVLAAGHTFGTVRGGGVVAWDNNETRGTLGIRGHRSTHRNTTRELLEDLERFTDVYQSRIGDLGAFVRSQGDAHFDVLASDERPDVTGQIHAEDFRAVHHLLQRFYRIILVDTGNNMRAENWLAAAGAADLLVVTSTVREDTGYSGLWMLDALHEGGYHNLKHKTITVLSDPSHEVDTRLAKDLVDVYEQRTRGVYRVPFDPALVSGSVVPYAQLSAATRGAWLTACAGMAEAL